MYRSDLVKAQEYFNGACQDNTVPGNWAYYSKSGSAVVYMCNYHSGNNPCRSDELLEALWLVDNKCGWQGAGWVFIKNWNKGYGRASNDRQGICSWKQWV